MAPHTGFPQPFVLSLSKHGWRVSLGRRRLAAALLLPLAALSSIPAYALRGAGLEENAAKKDVIQQLVDSPTSFTATSAAGLEEGWTVVKKRTRSSVWFFGPSGIIGSAYMNELQRVKTPSHPIRWSFSETAPAFGVRWTVSAPARRALPTVTKWKQYERRLAQRFDKPSLIIHPSTPQRETNGRYSQDITLYGIAVYNYDIDDDATNALIHSLITALSRELRSSKQLTISRPIVGFPPETVRLLAARLIGVRIVDRRRTGLEEPREVSVAIPVPTGSTPAAGAEEPWGVVPIAPLGFSILAWGPDQVGEIEQQLAQVVPPDKIIRVALRERDWGTRPPVLTNDQTQGWQLRRHEGGLQIAAMPGSGEWQPFAQRAMVGNLAVDATGRLGLTVGILDVNFQKALLMTPDGLARLLSPSDPAPASLTPEAVRILMVDDEPFPLGATSQAVSSALAQDGSLLVGRIARTQIKAVTTVAKAVAWIKTQKPQLVITDFSLGNGTGEAVARAAKKANPDAVVILETGEHPWPMRAEYGNLFDHVIGKPAPGSFGYTIIQRAVERHIIARLAAGAEKAADFHRLVGMSTLCDRFNEAQLKHPGAPFASVVEQAVAAFHERFSFSPNPGGIQEIPWFPEGTTVEDLCQWIAGSREWSATLDRQGLARLAMAGPAFRSLAHAVRKKASVDDQTILNEVRATEHRAGRVVRQIDPNHPVPEYEPLRMEDGELLALIHEAKTLAGLAAGLEEPVRRRGKITETTHVIPGDRFTSKHHDSVTSVVTAISGADGESRVVYQKVTPLAYPGWSSRWGLNGDQCQPITVTNWSSKPLPVVWDAKDVVWPRKNRWQRVPSRVFIFHKGQLFATTRGVAVILQQKLRRDWIQLLPEDLSKVPAHSIVVYSSRESRPTGLDLTVTTVAFDSDMTLPVILLQALQQVDRRIEDVIAIYRLRDGCLAVFV